jgi:predicted nucleic acid-binding protein
MKEKSSSNGPATQRWLRPKLVPMWSAQAPAWLEIRAPLGSADPSLASLDPGERDAIILAAGLSAEQLIVDDREGRRLAEERGIPVMGTLGVLKEAAATGPFTPSRILA